MQGSSGDKPALVPIDWEQLLLVYLHDPVDKALDIRGHESRAARYASRALGRDVGRNEIKGAASLADSLAAIAERLPMPTAGQNGERAVGLEDGRLDVRHPVSAQQSSLEELALDEGGVIEAIDHIVDGLPDPRSRFLALWRLLPERLAQCLGESFVRLPADTRVPDHTLIQHADITSGIWASRQSGAHGGAYLSLSLGPVQKFIEAARSVRDLWSGSAILSWLTFQGICPVLETLGPTALVYPALRGNPLMDLWLYEHGGLKDVMQLPPKASRRSPSIPNRFVALVPWGSNGAAAAKLADTCDHTVRKAWCRLAGDVRNCLDPALSSLDPDWAQRWQDQVDSFFEIRTAVMPERVWDDETLARAIGNTNSYTDVWLEVARVRSLADAIPSAERPGYAQHSAGRWQAQLEASARLMEAQRSIRHVPTTSPTAADEISPPKCSLLGSYEQMGPADFKESGKFWVEAAKDVEVSGVRLRNRERFSAVALCKRFAAPATLARDLRLKLADLRFPDTATVAAAEWLQKAGIDPDAKPHDWNGRWLHQKSQNGVEDGDGPPPASVWQKIEAARKDQGKPPSYYAILAMDADNMGQWLKGDHAPKVREVLHPKMVGYYEQLGEQAKAGLEAKRPVGPALHASISEALNNFASHIAPGIVQKYDGTMIYSGGDDVLALLPVRRAVACAADLCGAFRGEKGKAPGWIERRDGCHLLTMGNRATLSAGIAFVHFMEDLRLALDAARQAEKAAKNAGRNWLTLRFMRRSGEHSEAGLSWDLVPWFQELVQTFACGATDRWAYRLRAELPSLQADAFPDAAVSAEVRRLVDRTKKDDQLSGSTSPSGEDAERWWWKFSETEGRRERSSAELLEEFTLLCQGASFVARGHDV